MNIKAKLTFGIMNCGGDECVKNNKLNKYKRNLKMSKYGFHILIYIHILNIE